MHAMYRLPLVRLVLASLTGATLLAAGCADEPTRPPEVPGITGRELDPRPTVTPPFVGCRTGVQPSGALYQVCIPPSWNGGLLVWAHGYVSPEEPLTLPDDEVEGIPISAIVTGLEYAYATTSYRGNGLRAVEAVDDLVELMTLLEEDHDLLPLHTCLVGGSEGGLSAALAAERMGSPFNGAMLLCGPLGSFRGQINHFGDFRVVFDYFFPGVIPGSPIEIPSQVMTQWESTYEPAVRAAVAADPNATRQLLRVTRAAVDPSDPGSVAETVVDLIWYSVFATNDAKARLGGNPYGNRFRIYWGSNNDWRLNTRIQRFTADASARTAMQAYETTGALAVPAVALHTTRDPVTPYWHQPRYLWKVWRAGAARELISLPVFRYGHCEFTYAEVLAGFAVLVFRVTGQELIAFAEEFPSTASQREFLDLATEHGVRPRVVRRGTDRIP
jgi:pimeloyl-ACP methyl ester carboxylesterase